MNARLPHADEAMHASSAPADGDDRRRTDATDAGLTPEEIALLASCGERIRSGDWDQIRRTGLVTWLETARGRAVVPTTSPQ